ncbi:MAG: cell division protein ZapA [Acidobacteria bacterium]|nr:cell division protein ZapA [Acidobacteriota bacterium]
MTAPPQGIRVEIYDRVYHLRTDSEKDYTQRLAQVVDATMRTLAEKTHTYDSLRLAVLAALHFADECEQLRERYEKLNMAVSEKSLAFRQVLENISAEEK